MVPFFKPAHIHPEVALHRNKAEKKNKAQSLKPEPSGISAYTKRPLKDLLSSGLSEIISFAAAYSTLSLMK